MSNAGERKYGFLRKKGPINYKFGGVGFHVFHHLFATTKAHLENVLAKRWRGLSPSSAHLADKQSWYEAMLDSVAAHLNRLQQTGTEVYITTWGTKDTSEGKERVAYAKKIVDRLEYLCALQLDVCGFPGLLEEKSCEQVGYLQMERQRLLDPRALLCLWIAD